MLQNILLEVHLGEYMMKNTSDVLMMKVQEKAYEINVF